MGCNDIEIRNSEFVAKTQFLSRKVQILHMFKNWGACIKITVYY